MIRYSAALVAACAAALCMASIASAQTVSTGSAVFEIVRPFIVEVVSVLILALVGWLAGTVKAKFNIDIDAKHRDALQAALTNAAGLVINRAGGMASALILPNANPVIQQGVSYVIESAPDALKHFGITPESARQVLTEKLEAKIGVLTSIGAAAKA